MDQYSAQGFQLSPEQHRLWMLQQRDGTFYYVECTLLIEGVLDPAILNAALRQLEDRYEILRTTIHFLSDTRTPIQVIEDRRFVLGAAIDLGSLSEAEQQRELAALRDSMRRVGFVGTPEPVLQAQLVALGPDRHELLLNLPALCADATTMVMLAHEIGQAYAATLSGGELSGEVLQYADIAAWKNELAETDDGEAGRAYWRRQDLSALSRLRLPYEADVAARSAFAPRALTSTLSGDAVAQIERLAQTSSVSMREVLLACWFSLLWRLTEQPELIVGAAHDGRSYEELKDAFGIFTKFLPIRCSIAGQNAFSDVLTQVHEQARLAYTWHEVFTWELIADRLPAPATPHFLPWCFEFRDDPTTAVFDRLTLTIVELESCVDRFKLKLTCARREDSLIVQLHYDPQVIDPVYAKCVQAYFCTLVGQAVATPAARIADLDVVSQSPLDTLDRVTAPYPEAACIHRLFEAQAAQTPDAVAVIAPDATLTYRELDARANQLARYLQTLGVGPEKLVALYVERSSQAIVAILGILKAGGGYVPLDPRAPESRLAFILADCGALAIITDRVSNQLPAAAAPIISLDQEWSTISAQSADPITSAVTADHLAYVIYTSGSTGQPKGVYITHRGLGNLAHAQIEKFRITADSRVLQFASLSFDASVSEIWTALLAGAQLCVVPQDALMPGLPLIETLQKQAITVATLPPSILVALPAVDLPTLQTLVVAGEACPPAVVATWAGARHFCNAYGPTETTVCATVQAGLAIDQPPTIGHPIANMQVYVLDQRLRPVLAGQIGEIYIGGVGLARGYLNRPDLTAEKFIPHPFSRGVPRRVPSGHGHPPGSHAQATPGARLYRTGDLARYWPNGTLEFVRRLDQQVKIRGFRVELGEIEAALERHAALAQAVVIAREEQPGDMRLVAYVVENQETGSESLTSDLRAYLREYLPDYMIPSAFVALKSLPLTPNGKVDREALPAPEQLLPTIADRPGPSRSPIEEVVAGIWIEVLGLEDLSIHDDFFDLGGHSLLAAQVMFRIYDAFQVDLPQRVLFESPTIAGLAAEIEAARQSALGRAVLPLQPVARDQALPLSFAQQRLWFLDQLQPGSIAYNIPAAVRLTGPLDVDRLAACFTAIVRRHEVLRTTFAVHDGQPVQQIHPPQPVAMPLHDLAAQPETTRAAVAEQTALALIRQPFDLQQGPVFRAQVLRLTPTEHLLVVVLHHVVADGWSTSVLIHELATLYRAGPAEWASVLPALPIQYADYAVWQRQWLTGSPGPEGTRMAPGATLEQQWAYWQQQLRGPLPTLALPTDHPRPAVQSERGARQQLQVDAALTARLKALSRQADVTLFMTLLAAFQTLLARYAHQEDIIIGTPIAGRSHVETEGLIGCFVNTLVLRTDLSGNPSFRALLGRVREVALGAYAHQDLPFEYLVDALHPVRDLSRTPLFQVVFSLQNTPMSTLELPDLTLAPLDLDTGAAKFDLWFTLIEGPEGLRGDLEYNADLFEAATISRFTGHFQHLLERFAADPDQRIADVPLLAEREWQQMLDWNATARSYPQDVCIHQLFEDQAERTPDAVAVIFNNVQLTYRELNTRAHTLAQYLRACGVGGGPGSKGTRNVPVGLCVERSPELLIGLLAVLKAGGAYLPLDLTYPKERIAFILKDAGAPILLTQSSLVERLPDHTAQVLLIDRPDATTSVASEPSSCPAVWPEHLAYVIYTSGSTGTPKGVMISHRNVVNFFTGMDERIGCSAADTLVATTSVAFDISVLELLWTLCRGATVVLIGEDALLDLIEPTAAPAVDRGMNFSLFYFANNAADGAENSYRLLIEGAKFADEHDFCAVWTPERHFHAFGGLYPNPAITSAALATITRWVQLRGGSVVLPLHHPVRVAEEWAVVDRLSQGRVGIAFASGWHANDFVLFPDHYADRRALMFENITQVQRLWRGERITLAGGTGGDVEVEIFPKPLQPELPIWITASGSVETFRKAGELGANVLTHLLGQTVAELTEKIAAYRTSLSEHHPGRIGQVALMLHAFLGLDREAVREQVRAPFTEYLRSSADLMQGLIKSIGVAEDIESISEQYMDEILALAFERYFEQALFGTPETCQPLIEQLKTIGVDEVACLIDFGVDTDAVLTSLEHLETLRERSNRQPQERYTLPAQLTRHNATLFQCTPSLLRLLTLDPATFGTLGRLRALLVGGEALPAALAEQVTSALPVHLFNMYGPTETTIWSATHQVQAVSGSVPIGRPIANTELYVLSPQLQPVPVGVPGELYIGGAGLAYGYLRRPALTAERFIPNPFGAVPGTRLYKTGDLARYLPDGNLEFLGRVDYQVKIRGFRIELGEIEAVLRALPTIRDVAVDVWTDSRGELRLAAFLVASEPIPSIPELRRHLLERLPEYMVPAAFVFMDALPLTPNGKIDRRALPTPDALGAQERPDVAAEYTPPQTAVEQQLAAIWMEVLGLSHVGVHDNFFELGGDSILSIQITAKASQAGLSLTPRQLFKHQTIAELAPVVGTITVAQAEQGLVSGDVPLTPVQHWFFEQRLIDPQHYNQAVLLEVHRRLEAPILSQAVKHLLLHHDALRLRFVPEADGWKQTHAAPSDPIPFAWVDLSAASAAEQSTAVETHAAALQAGLDLTAGPLFHVTYFDLGVNAPGRLLIVAHHLLIDGISWRVILEDLQTACRQLSAEQPVVLPAKTTSFRAWAQQLVEYAQAPAVQREQQYWLADSRSRVARLPLDQPDGHADNIVASSATVTVSLSAEETQALLYEAPKAYNTQINDLLLTALAQAVSSWSGTRRVLIDLEAHGREEVGSDANISRTVGWFTSIFPVLLDLEAASGPEVALKTIKEQLRQVPQHGLGYGLLRYLSADQSLRERLRTLPPAEITFNYLGQFDQTLPQTAIFTPAQESPGSTSSPRGQRRYLLEVVGLVVGGQFRLNWTYSEALHRHATIALLAENFIAALRELINHCRSPEVGGYTPSDFPTVELSQTKLEKLLAEIDLSDWED